MTLEEAANILDRRTTIPGDGYTYEQINGAIDLALAALQTPTREQVEKMRGDWIVEDAGEGDRRGKCSMCGYRTPWGLRFCPVCGAAQTDEAVEMARLEAPNEQKV